jgi:hypothetical protein
MIYEIFVRYKILYLMMEFWLPGVNSPGICTIGLCSKIGIYVINE